MTNSTRNFTGHPFAHSPSPCRISIIHACYLTSANSRPVDNATAATNRHPDGWMALREIGGGR